MFLLSALVRKQYRRVVSSVVTIQKNYRAHFWRRVFLRLRLAAIVLQKHQRGRQGRSLCHRLREERRREEEEKERRRREEEEEKERRRLEEERKQQEEELRRRKEEEEERLLAEEMKRREEEEEEQKMEEKRFLFEYIFILFCFMYLLELFLLFLSSGTRWSTESRAKR